MNIEIEGLDNLLKTFDNAGNNFKKEGQKRVNKLGNKLLRLTKLRTPVAKEDGGTLRRGWNGRSGILEFTVSNNLHYAPHVEFGHRTRQGKGGNSKNPNYKYKPKKGGIKYVKGRYMLTKSVEEIEKEMEREFSTMIENLWE